MTDAAAGGGDEVRARILDAAVTELAAGSVDRFSLERVAARAGLDPLVVKQVWANTAQLYNAALLAFAARHIVIPDTGTLRGDLLGYAKSYARAMNSPLGRRLIDAVTVSARDWDVKGSRSAFLDVRHSRVNVMVQRGIQRGECAADVDGERFMDLLGGCLSMSLLYYDRPISDSDCEQVVDMLLYGIVSR